MHLRSFKLTDESSVSKIIDESNPKKATGEDKISVKLVKLGKPSLVKPITNLINTMISKESPGYSSAHEERPNVEIEL